MSKSTEININKGKAEKLLKKIIVMESTNNKSKVYNYPEMVKKIKKAIEEEVECY